MAVPGAGAGLVFAAAGPRWLAAPGRPGGSVASAACAAASCCGCGRDTSLARMAELSVIFIPAIGLTS